MMFLCRQEGEKPPTIRHFLHNLKDNKKNRQARGEREKNGHLVEGGGGREEIISRGKRK